jgi:hypothetical protein
MLDLSSNKDFWKPNVLNLKIHFVLQRTFDGLLLPSISSILFRILLTSCRLVIYLTGSDARTLLVEDVLQLDGEDLGVL